MTQIKSRNGVILRSIFHPSDFTEASEVAFEHALKIAIVSGAKLTMLHVEASPAPNGKTSQESERRSSDGSSFRKTVPRARSGSLASGSPSFLGWGKIR